MNKTIIIAVIALLVLGGGAFILSQNANQSTDSMMEDTAMDKTDAMSGDSGDSMSDESMEMMADGRYVEYTDGALESMGEGRRVLYFYANWCPTCRPADADLKENMSQIPEDVTVYRVNYNDDQTSADEEALANTYDVTYQHTFVQIDADGNAVTTWNGGATEELLSNLR